MLLSGLQCIKISDAVDAQNDSRAIDHERQAAKGRA
jgi:hypothetical protein